MATKEAQKFEPKTILMVVIVVVLVLVALWRIVASSSAISGGEDLSFSTKIQAPPDSTRPPGFERPGTQSSDKQ